MENILSDKTKFELLEKTSESIIQKMGKSFNSYLYSIKDEYYTIVEVDDKGTTSTRSVLMKKKEYKPTNLQTNIFNRC